MLVPSTFTGWYRKTMMKAEIASEMMRSRTQTESTGIVRDGTGGRDLSVRVRNSAGLACSGMLSFIIRLRRARLQGVARILRLRDGYRRATAAAPQFELQ